MQSRRPGLNPWAGKICWRREWLPTPVFWPGEFQWQAMGLQRVGTQLSDFTFKLYCFYLNVCFGFRLLSFTSFSIWEVRLLSRKLYSFKYNNLNSTLAYEDCFHCIPRGLICCVFIFIYIKVQLTP